MGGCETNSVETLLLQHDAPVLAGITVVRPRALGALRALHRDPACGSARLVYQELRLTPSALDTGPSHGRGYVRVVDPSGPGASVVTSPPGIVPESAGPTRYRSGEWFESRNSLVRSVEVSGQLSNQAIKEEIDTLWALTRHFD